MIPRAARLAWRAFLRFQDHAGPDRAAAVAYYTLLSLLPLLIFLIAVGSTVAGSFDEAYSVSLYLFRGLVVHLDEPALSGLRSFVERASRFQWPAILLFAWTGRRIFVSLFSALEVVFETPSRGFLKGNLLALGLVIVAGLAQLLTMLAATVLATAEGILRRLAPSEGLVQGLTAGLLTYVLPVVVTSTFFFILYRVAARRLVTTSHALLGALLATVLWELAKAGFAWYVRNLTRYAGLYGALEGVIVLALWLELSVAIVLYCGEIVALRLPPQPDKG